MDAVMNSSKGVPEWLNKGDNAWQMVAATLVAMMSMPGLMAIYAGVVRERWATNSALMTVYAFAATLVCWVVYAYKMAFGERMVFFWGRPGLALSHSYLLQQAALPASDYYYRNGTLKTPMEMTMFPMATLVYFQFAFAAVAVVLVAGSLLARMEFRAWMIFVPLWLTLGYTVGAFSIWGGGFLYHWGVIDFAGGFVVHLSAGTAGFTAAAWLGKRSPNDQANMKEIYSLPLVAVGGGLLWLGWTGFNGGSPYAANLDASMAVINTQIGAATSVVVWTILDVMFDARSSLVHAVQGMIVGLVCITPAAGVVEGWAAIVIGACGGGMTWYMMVKMEMRCMKGCLGGICKWLRNVDDTLRVVETHAVSGMIGGLLTGLLADPELCELYLPGKGSKGAFYGHPTQLVKQFVAAIIVIVWNVAITSLICWLIPRLRIPLKMSDEELSETVDPNQPLPRARVRPITADEEHARDFYYRPQEPPPETA